MIGPMLGRWNAAANKFGESPYNPSVPASMRDEYNSDIAKVQEWLSIIPMQEAKATLGGRPNYLAVQKLAEVSPKLADSLAMYRGATTGYRQRLQKRYDELTNKFWSGSPPILRDLGMGRTLDRDTAMKFYRMAGSDPKLATRLALEAGFDVPDGQ